MRRRLLLVAVASCVLPWTSGAGAQTRDADGIQITATRTASMMFNLQQPETIAQLQDFAGGSYNPFAHVEGWGAGFEIADARGQTMLASMISRHSGVVPLTQAGVLPRGRYRLSVVVAGAGPVTIQIPLESHRRITLRPSGATRAGAGWMPIRPYINPAIEGYSASLSLPRRGLVLGAVTVRETQKLVASTIQGEVCVTDPGQNCDTSDSYYSGSYSGTSTGPNTSYTRYLIRVARSELPETPTELHTWFIGNNRCDSAYLTAFYFP